MQLSGSGRRALSASLAALMFAACSSGPQGSNSLPSLRFTEDSTSVQTPRYEGPRDVYVADYGVNGIVLLKNKTYKKAGMLAAGPGPVFLDKRGDFYVASLGSSPAILEFAPRTHSPIFLYSAGIVNPAGIAVDRHGNVYEADSGSGNGFVNEYAPQKNVVTHTCSPGGEVEGVAVDSKGDVFVDFNTSVSGKIVEYRRTLRGCSGEGLGVTLSFAGGMAIDSNADLLVCDQTTGVDLIDPPYNRVSGMLGSGYADPLHVKLNKANTLAFVTDIGAAVVWVVEYPSGRLVTKLGHGIVDPVDAVDGPNAVY